MACFVSFGSELLVRGLFTGTDHYHASLAKKSDGMAFLFDGCCLFVFSLVGLDKNLKVKLVKNAKKSKLEI